MTSGELAAMRQYVRAANYIAAAQVYLRSNFLLAKPFTQDDIKPRLLGHWGTCPGINFVYAQLNRLIQAHQAQMLFVIGTGHGFPALQANLFIEGTLGKYYPQASENEAGLGYLIKNFSWPYGFPSHSNPGAPGVILEGGELGYALATAYGSVLDNPDLITACLIGDGEAETAPTAAAWHLNKFVDPRGSGAVLPILHLNGYKISGPTVFGRMSDRELKALWRGYGYEPRIISGKGVGVYNKMADALEEAYQAIRKIQEDARRAGAAPEAPRFPMIILRTPKGWTGIKELHGEKIEGNFLAHQVVAPNAKTDPEEFAALSKWLRSYRFHELFDPERGFAREIRALVPESRLRMGDNRRVFGGEATTELARPRFQDFCEDATRPGTIGSSSMRRLGAYLKEVFAHNAAAANFRLFSPDETYSNKLDAVFGATKRPFLWRREPWDKDLDPAGRVTEMLSEHSLQGLLQGYVLTGRHGVFASYEAFIQVVSSMVDQYAKFLKVAREIPWRGSIPSLNYILTSSGWRQEHNGFSHQNPGFISGILNKAGSLVQVYFPPCGNSALAALDASLASRDGINVIVAGKTLEPRWLTPELALEELERGLMIWDFASDPDPDIVLAAVGDYMTKEALAAIDIVKREAPQIKIRFVNIMTLSVCGIGSAAYAPALDFEHYFTADKPIIFNFHGYPETLKALLTDRACRADQFSVHGYIENGSTTTPFDMQVRNGTSRYQLALEVFKKTAEAGVIDGALAWQLAERYSAKLAAHKEYIVEHGVDPEEIENWQWTRSS